MVMGKVIASAPYQSMTDTQHYYERDRHWQHDFALSYRRTG
jgi:hypothetical protein